MGGQIGSNGVIAPPTPPQIQFEVKFEFEIAVFEVNFFKVEIAVVKIKHFPPKKRKLITKGKETEYEP